MVSIPACHAGDRGSIPRFGASFFFLHKLSFAESNSTDLLSSALIVADQVKQFYNLVILFSEVIIL